MGEPRTPFEIVDKIRAFEPVDGSWLRLDDLLSELWAIRAFGQYIPDLFAVFERFPDDDGAGVLWTILHGVEKLPGYETELVQSVRRRPSMMAVTMVGRLLNSGVSEVQGQSLVGLLKEIGASACSDEIRAGAKSWALKHAKVEEAVQ